MKNSEIAVRKNDAISRGVGMTTQIYAAKAENAEVWDVEGRRYIDFAGGIAVLNTGHRSTGIRDRSRPCRSGSWPSRSRSARR